MAAKGVSERLEHVRSALGETSVRAFYDRLAEGWKGALTYRVAAYYHSGKRAPPLAYVARVCEVFGVSASYLLLGAGPMFEADAPRWEADTENLRQQDDWRAAKLEEFWKEIGLEHLPYHIRHHFLETWSSLNNTGWFYHAVTDQLHPEVGRRIHRQLLDTFGKGGRPNVYSEEFARYATAMLFAIELGVHVPFTLPKEARESP